MYFVKSAKNSRIYCPLLRRSFVSKPVVPKRRVQLVALDVDGTLLDDRSKLHSRVRDAIFKVADLGVPVLLSTGRCSDAALKLVNAGEESPLPLSGGIFLGGAVGQDSFGKTQRDVKLVPEAIHKVLDFCDQYQVVPVLIGRNRFWCAEQNAWTQRLVDAGDPKPLGVGKRALYRKAEKVNLICIMGERLVIDDIELKLAKVVDELHARVVRPFEFMLDVVPLDRGSGLGGKAAGLAELCSWRGIPAESVMVVGDSGNDVDMMEWAGWAVAMGNASERAKSVADAIVASNIDAVRPGVAEALEEFVIKPCTGYTDA